MASVTALNKGPQNGDSEVDSSLYCSGNQNLQILPSDFSRALNSSLLSSPLASELLPTWPLLTSSAARKQDAGLSDAAETQQGTCP